MTTQTKTNTPDELHELAAVLEEVPAATLEDYADVAGLNLVTEFHDRQQRQYGLSMLLDACQRGGVEYVITAGWPTPNLTTTEADAVTEQLAQAGTHLVCLATGHPGDGTPPAWWNDEEGAWMRELDAMREEDRRQREQTSETGADSQVNQAGRTGNASQAIETSKEVHHA